MAAHPAKESARRWRRLGRGSTATDQYQYAGMQRARAASPSSIAFIWPFNRRRLKNNFFCAAVVPIFTSDPTVQDMFLVPRQISFRSEANGGYAQRSAPFASLPYARMQGQWRHGLNCSCANARCSWRRRGEAYPGRNLRIGRVAHQVDPRLAITVSLLPISVIPLAHVPIRPACPRRSDDASQYVEHVTPQNLRQTGR
jgi:hypothetical protein